MELMKSQISDYCCPVKLKKIKLSYSKPFIIGLRCFIFKYCCPVLRSDCHSPLSYLDNLYLLQVF